jgi:hypothetical protein
MSAKNPPYRANFTDSSVSVLTVSQFQPDGNQKENRNDRFPVFVSHAQWLCPGPN